MTNEVQGAGRDGEVVVDSQAYPGPEHGWWVSRIDTNWTRCRYHAVVSVSQGDGSWRTECGHRFFPGRLYRWRTGAQGRLCKTCVAQLARLSAHQDNE